MSTIVFLAFIGFASSFFGVSVGGAGLIIVPALIFSGLSPHEAVATATFGYFGISISGWYAFHKKEKLNYKVALPTAIFFNIGVVVGAFMLQEFDGKSLKSYMGVCFLFILVLSLTSKKIEFSKINIQSKIVKNIGYFLLILSGIYASVIGGGVSIIVTLILVFCYGEDYLQSAGTRKPVLTVRSVLSTIIYYCMGLVHTSYGVALILSTCLGSYFGALYAIKKGNQWVQRAFTIIIILTSLKMIIGK